jgi:hypothetical protein
MKNNNSQGYDQISVGMIKATGPNVMQWLYQVFRKIWIENNTKGLV